MINNHYTNLTNLIIEIQEITTPTNNNITDKKRHAKETPPNQTSSRPEPKRSNVYTLLLMLTVSLNIYIYFFNVHYIDFNKFSKLYWFL